MFDQPALPARRNRLFILKLAVEIVDLLSAFGVVGILVRKVRSLKADCWTCELIAGQFIRARFGGQRRAVVVRVWSVVNRVGDDALSVGNERCSLLVPVGRLRQRRLPPPVANR